jgi:hypothetical protein
LPEVFLLLGSSSLQLLAKETCDRWEALLFDLLSHIGLLRGHHGGKWALGGRYHVYM